MKKSIAFLLIIFIAPIIGGFYGILHDQFTYSVSPEYYTKFKFYQFGLMKEGKEAIFPNPRIQISIVGWRATWWMGVPIGIILGLAALYQKNGKHMLAITAKAFAVTLIIAFACGLYGLFYGKYSLAKTGVNWWLPDNLVDQENFIAVGAMHNFSYEGGVLGLLVAVLFSIWKKPKADINQSKLD